MRSGVSRELLQGLFFFFPSRLNTELTFIYDNKTGYNNKQKVKIKNGSIKGFISVLTMDNGYGLGKIYL